MNDNKKTPLYINTWMFVAAVLIYVCITMALESTMAVKNAPAVLAPIIRSEQVQEKLQALSEDEAEKLVLDIFEGEVGDHVDLNITFGPAKGIVHVQKQKNSERMGFHLIVIILLGTIFNFPFRIYFRRKRKGAPIPETVTRYCKRFLRKSPLINAGIFVVPILLQLVWMLFTLVKGGSAFSDRLEMSMFKNILIISFFSCDLVGLFIYSWQKYRVDNKYLDIVYSRDELNKRPMNFKVDRIAKRLWLSSIMTTLLPISIIIFYFLLSLSSIADLSALSEGDLQLLFGEYMKIADAIFGNRTNFLYYYYLEIASNFDGIFYINTVDTIVLIAGIAMGMVVALLYVVFFIRWTTESIVFPVKKLLDSMARISQGELGVVTSVRNNDEIGELSVGFNHMSQKLDNYVHHVKSLNESYFRFVPRQFIEYLGKNDISQVQLGDQVEGHMTVVFTDIRDFTTLSETMTPEENFNFINTYLGAMEPAIIENNGFIDKYIGDSIMAIFGRSPEDAIKASLGMKANLARLNEERTVRGLRSIRMGIGIHAGHLMLGLVGGNSRIDGTVISDAVNLASRIEGLTKLYGVSILISQTTFEDLSEEVRQNINSRVLDCVQVKGKNETVIVLEILDPHDPEDIVKLEYKDAFTESMDLLRGGEYEKVCANLEELEKQYPQDQVITIYLERARQLLLSGGADGWEGVTIMNEK